MRNFYRSSHWFWVISRILFVLMFLISLVQIMSDGPLHSGYEVLANGVCMVGMVVLAILAVIELMRGNKPTWLRIIGGVFLVLCGLALFAVLAMGMVPGGGLLVLALLFALWFGLAGVRDLVMR